MKRSTHILVAAVLGAAVVAAAWVGPRVHAQLAYGTLKAQLRCGNVLTVATSAQKRTLGDRVVFCGMCDGRPYLLVGTSVDDLQALPIGDGDRPVFRAQQGNRFVLACADRTKSVTLVGDRCRVEDSPQ